MFRRTWAQIWFAVIMALAVTAGCGGGGGGGGTGGTGGTGGGSTIGFVKQVGTIISDDSTFPFDDVYDTKTQYLYTAAEIGGSGKITKIRLQQSQQIFNAVTCPNTTVKMGHTTVSSLTTTWANNVGNGAGAEQTVVSNATITIPAAPAFRWIEITFDTPFYYNGVDNLVVDIERTTACYDASGPAFVRTTTFFSPDSRAYSYEFDNTPGTAEYNTVNADFVDERLPFILFVFAGGDNTQDYGGSSPDGVPFVSSAPLRMQNLYFASDINGSGPITGIAFQTYATLLSGITRTYTYTMTLSHATVMTLDNTFANNYAGTKTTVASAVTFTVPAGIPAGEWFWVPIPSGTFTYNGYDNLIVEVATTSGSDDVSLMGTNRPGSVQRVLAFGSTAAATGTVADDLALHIKLRFNGDTMSVLTPTGMSGGVTDVMPFYGPAGKSQYLYLATELGTKGTISKIACRNTGSVDAASGMTLTVEMGHTLAETLGATYASNFTSPVTVFSGPISTPAVTKGDWVDIALTTPFAYNGRDNLVVQMAGTGSGPAAPICVIDDASPELYASRRVFNTNPSATVGTGVTDRLMDMRFTFQ